MKRRRLLAIIISCLAIFSIVACGSSSGSTKKEGEPKTRIKNGIDVDEIDFVSLDESGITLSFTHNHMNVVILPKSFEVDGEKYSLFGSDGELNPEVHFRVDGSDTDNFSLDIKEGETHLVTISIDGVTDYTHFKATVDNTVYQDDGKTYPIRDVSFEVITE